MPKFLVVLGNGARIEADDLAKANLIARTYLDAEHARREHRARAADLLGIDADAIARADWSVPSDGLYIPRNGAGQLLAVAGAHPGNLLEE